MAHKKLQDLKDIQKKFSDLFFDEKKMTEEERIERHKVFTLALHSEVASLSDAVHYKDHRPIASETDRQKILYESIDLLRYNLAILNLWEFTSEEIEDAFDSKNAYLWDRETRGIQNWTGQPVVIFDVDDVIAQFRAGFFKWVEETHGVKFDVEDSSYYVTQPVGNMTNEEVFMQFIKEGGIRTLEANHNVIESMWKLQNLGVWIHLLTARPSDNLKCLYDTHFWLSEMSIPYNSVSLSSEKYRWLADKPFFRENKIVCAVDDSPKHASEYAQHDIVVFVPKRAYNEDVWDVENVITFDWWKDDLSDKIQELLS